MPRFAFQQNPLFSWTPCRYMLDDADILTTSQRSQQTDKAMSHNLGFREQFPVSGHLPMVPIKSISTRRRFLLLCLITTLVFLVVAQNVTIFPSQLHTIITHPLFRIVKNWNSDSILNQTNSVQSVAVPSSIDEMLNLSFTMMTTLTSYNISFKNKSSVILSPSGPSITASSVPLSPVLPIVPRSTNVASTILSITSSVKSTSGLPNPSMEAFESTELNMSSLFLGGGGQDNNLTCKYPLLDPFDKSILKYVDHPRSYKCVQTQPYLSYLDNLGRILINETEWKTLNDDNLTCKWRELDRAVGNSDNSVSKTNFQPLLLDTPTPISTDTAEVECITINSTGHKIRIYNMVHPHPRKLNASMVENGDDQLSVLMFTLDSVSLSMFRRQLPDTYNYLTTQLGAFIFRGYNKVADNTFPNMIPMLTGKRVYNQQEGMPDEFGLAYNKIKYDNFPLIWRNFSQEKGYKTAFVEDSPKLGLFHYIAQGFAKKPVDWYFRPYMLSRGDKVGKGSRFCYANSPRYAHQVELGERLLRECSNYRCFIYDFFTEMSHDHCCEIERSDRMFVKSFELLHSSGYLNKTVVLVMGDHGHRFAGLRATQVGLLEERLPMLGIVFPEWFLQLHPNIKNNLLINQWRLSTPFDIHETLLDILHANYDGSQRPVTQRGLSQLYPLPLNRTCISAGIPEHYCTCTQGENAAVKDEIVQKVGSFIISHVNELLAKLSNLCSTLLLKEILHAEVFSINQKIIHNVKGSGDNKKFDATPPPKAASKVNQYRVLVEASPSGALLEAMVHYRSDSGVMTISNDVSRINKYGNQSACIEDVRLKRYCLCK